MVLLLILVALIICIIAGKGGYRSSLLMFVVSLFISYLPVSLFYGLSHVFNSSEVFIHTGGFVTTVMFIVMFGSYVRYVGDDRKSIGRRLFTMLALLNMGIIFMEWLLLKTPLLETKVIATNYGYYKYIDANILIKIWCIFTLLRAVVSYIVFKLYMKKTKWCDLEDSVVKELECERSECDEKQKHDEEIKDAVLTGDIKTFTGSHEIETNNLPDLPISELTSYISQSHNIAEIERLIGEALRTIGQPSDTVMIISRNANIARRMNVTTSEFYRNIEAAIGDVSSEHRAAVDMIKQLALEATILTIKGQH